MPTLHVIRSYRTADLARPYQIVLDGKAVGKIRTHASTELSIAPGSHTLQIFVPKLLNGQPGLASPPRTFEAGNGESVEFVCHPPTFPTSWYKWVACLLGEREWWVELENTR